MRMKKVFVVILLTLFTITFIPAQNKNSMKGLSSNTRSLVGYLVDRNCAKGMVMADVKKSDAKAAKHTKECCLDDACKANGYGIVTGGKFYKFDDAGDKKAVDYLNATKKEDNIKVEVVGRIDGTSLTVESIKDFKFKGKEHTQKG
jgi:hypothetical protein